MDTLAERIKELRLENDLTQERFGCMFGIVKSTVSLYESGKSTPDDTLKKSIAEYFNVSLDYLMGVSNTRNPYKNQVHNDKTDLKIEYLQIAKELQDNNIEIDDIKALIEIIKRNR